jgi:hypothetical protein
MMYRLSQNRFQAVFEAGCSLMEKLFDLHRALIEGKFCESSHESSPWSGGGITIRWSRPADQELTPEEKKHFHNLTSE